MSDALDDVPQPDTEFVSPGAPQPPTPPTEEERRKAQCKTDLDNCRDTASQKRDECRNAVLAGNQDPTAQTRGLKACTDLYDADVARCEDDYKDCIAPT
jgi:hypothetical protein